MTILTKGTSAFYDRNIAQMAGLRRDAERLQEQIATGERLSKSSDDPVAASRLRNLSRQDRLAQIDSDNADRIGAALQQADSTLFGISDNLARARELALQAASSTLSDAQRGLIAEELTQLRDSMLAAANYSGSDGRPLFAGQSDGPAYAIDAAGNAIYAGTAEAGKISLGEGIDITRGVTGPEIFEFTSAGATTDIFAHLKGLAEALRGASADPAAAARASLAGFDEALESLTRSQTVIGVRAAWVETVQDRQIETSASRAQETADVGGVEFASTVAQLQQMLVVLEASQASFARVSQLSLFNSI